MKKVLYSANTYRHLSLCHRPYLKWFGENNYIVHTACDNDKKLEGVTKSFGLSIKRSPFRFSNIKAFFELKKIINKERYDLIITNTPMGSVITRLAALKYRKKNNIKIVYIAHGFHFFKGCPKINYILYYPIEKLLSKYTDIIITINDEDYLFAKKHFKTVIKKNDGIGFDPNKFKSKLNDKEKDKLRKKIGINKNDFVISYIAEISSRKRQMYLVKVFNEMKITNEKLLLIGENTKAKKIIKYINKNKLNSNIILIDFNNNINDYLEISDLVLSVSKQEGLPLNIMEAMYKEKPIILTDCRGNRDLITDNVNGILIGLNDKEKLKKSIYKIKNVKDFSFNISSNKERSLKYSVENVLPVLTKIYEELI